jgi:hypothetical protein
LIYFRIKGLEGARLLPPLVFSIGPENSHSSYISDKCDLNGLFHETSDVRMDEEILANVSSFNEQNTEISDGENEINSELEEENESDYDSDGH